MGTSYQVEYILLSGPESNPDLKGAHYHWFSDREAAQARADHLNTEEGRREEIQRLQSTAEYAGMQLEIREITIREQIAEIEVDAGATDEEIEAASDIALGKRLDEDEDDLFKGLPKDIR